MADPKTPEQWATRITAELNLIALDYGHDDIISVHANEVVTLMVRFMAEFRDAEVERLRAELATRTDERDEARRAWLKEHILRDKAEDERGHLAEQVKGDRLHAVIKAALIAYWRLERGKGEPDQLDLAAAGSHAFTLVDALGHAGLPTGREAMHDAHGVRDAVTSALRALDGTEVNR